MNEAPKIKGVALRNFSDVIADICEPDVAQRIVSSYPPDIRAAFERGRIVATGWYDLAWYRAMHATARAITRAGPSLPRRIGRESTRRDLTGIYRVFLQMVSPQLMVSISSRIWGLYYNVGTMNVLEKR